MTSKQLCTVKPGDHLVLAGNTRTNAGKEVVVRHLDGRRVLVRFIEGGYERFYTYYALKKIRGSVGGDKLNEFLSICMERDSG